MSNPSFLGSSFALGSPVVLIALVQMIAAVPISGKDKDDPADTTCGARPHSLIVTAAVLEIRSWAHMSSLGLDYRRPEPLPRTANPPTAKDWYIKTKKCPKPKSPTQQYQQKLLSSTWEQKL